MYNPFLLREKNTGMIQIRTTLAFCLIVILMNNVHGQAGQLTISRLAGIPNAPSPYLMRDWKKTAQQYDSLLYNRNISGQYLPLIYLQNSGVNYPNQEKFGLHTFVGTKSPLGNEAINVLPSLVGATLTGINKTDQFGKNWVKMSRDFFNLKNGEGLYLNGASTQSGNDWWYDVMPNIYFYQLYDLYGNTDGIVQSQFTSIAQQFSRAIRAMGGNDKPWTQADMNYRAWNFKEMKPLISGVKEPEAAGGMAWVLYHAYKVTHEDEYLKASEWAMEFLNSLNSNPSYELQLPYGVYIAAKMNAELNTSYDIPKMLNWCFDRGPLRGWGCIKGKWGNLDVTGLIGEANDNGNDYAFQMNGLQQAGALVPMLRYEKRYTRDIARWVLHLANANRLFYHGFLPADQQDASAWSAVNDPQQAIGYEALRQIWLGKSPFSTGDALKSGWSATNLALYGTSSLGYLGGIIEKTNVDKILKIDLLKTDFFRDNAFPTYVYYNPGNTTASVEIELGSAPLDIYEALSEEFILKGSTGTQTIPVPANEAVMVVLCPAGGEVSYKRNQMMVNGVTIDFSQNKTPFTLAPRIQALAADSTVVQQGANTSVYCKAEDNDSQQLAYEWSADNGAVVSGGSRVEYVASGSTGSATIRCIVKDESGNVDTAWLQLEIVEKINTKPVVPSIQTEKSMVLPNETVRLWCDAFDADGDSLEYSWTSDGGQMTVDGNEVFFMAGTEGIFTIELKVSDGLHAPQNRTQKILVKYYDDTRYNALAYYDFAGNANDKSGNALNGSAKGVILTSDKNNRAQQAYYFNGGNQHILVPNDPLMNFQEAITVCTWFKPISLPEKETFLVSHGSWQERWKLSITQDRKLRWTINTSNGISDLDGITSIANDQYHHTCASYDGDVMLIYVDGKLENFKKHNGTLNKTTKGLTIGQMVPEIADYNFKGVMDEVVLYASMTGPAQTNEIFESGIINQSQEYTINEWKVVPNPFQAYVELRCLDCSMAGGTAELLDLKGSLLMNTTIKGGEARFETTGLTEGYYLLKIKNEEGTYTLPLIKVK